MKKFGKLVGKMAIFVLIVALLMPHSAFAATQLATPSFSQVSKTSSSITVYWSSVSGATGYRVKFDGEQGYTNVSSTSFSKGGLTPDTYYTFEVQAYGTGYTDSNWAYIGHYTLLSTPSITSVSATRTSITINWTPIDWATSYQIRADSTNKSSTTTSYTHTDLTPGTSHTYKVRAINPYNYSEYSSMATVSTLP